MLAVLGRTVDVCDALQFDPQRERIADRDGIADDKDPREARVVDDRLELGAPSLLRKDCDRQHAQCDGEVSECP